MRPAGYHNRVARVDLSTGEVRYESIPEEDAVKYVGARGLGVKYLLDNGPSVDPLSPENLLSVMTGPLTGTMAPMSGRLAVVTKSPLTGTCVDSHMGGWTAAQIKWAGLDGLLFKGKSDRPVYALVENSSVTLHDASEIWGKRNHETIKWLKAKHGDVGVMSIGPAGERQVRFANFMNDNDRSAGRGGTGAVAGIKNLKAIVIKPHGKRAPDPADEQAFHAAHKEALNWLMKIIVTEPRTGDLSRHGTNVLMNMANELGALPTRNSQRSEFALADAIGGETIADTILVANPTCHACPVACKKQVKITDGKYSGLQMESFEYESAWALGGNCDNGNAASIAYMIDLCNDLGMDTIEMGNALSLTMEATEKGAVRDGIPWGDTDAMAELILKIGAREGIGEELSYGPARAAAKWGVPHLTMSVKGMSIPAYDPRGIKGMGIGYATSNRGACHLRGYTPAAEVVGWVLGAGKEIVDPLAWKGKAGLVTTFQNVYGFTDSLDICKFSTFSEPLDVFAAQYSTFTGVPLDPAGLLKVGERVYNLERYYNNLNGFGAGSDYLPTRFTEEKGSGAASESVCELDDMLADYYSIRGWDNGVVPEQKLRELEII